MLCNRKQSGLCESSAGVCCHLMIYPLFVSRNTNLWEVKIKFSLPIKAGKIHYMDKNNGPPTPIGAAQPMKQSWCTTFPLNSLCIHVLSLV